MKQQDVERMFRVLQTKEMSTPEDMTFFRNNLEGFNTLLLNVATGELISRGVDEEVVEALLVPLVTISKMAGANDFSDFVNVAGMFREEGLA